MPTSDSVISTSLFAPPSCILVSIILLKDFKEKCFNYDLDIEHELIITCLNNNHDFNMINQFWPDIASSHYANSVQN